MLWKVRQGFDVVIEQDNQPIAVLGPPHVKGRKISEVIAALEPSGAYAFIDDEFARMLSWESMRIGNHGIRPPRIDS